MLTTAPDSLAGNSADSLRHLNAFLRGEISATETYRMAIAKVSDDQRASVAANMGLLQSIQEEHQRAASTLRDRIHELGGEATDSSGAWGAWATAVQGTMNLFGDASALRSLRLGEEQGLKDYESACDEIDESSRQLVQNQLVPAQQRHLAVLDQLIAGQGQT